MPNVLKTFRTYVDYAYLTNREAFIEALRDAVLDEPAEPSDDAALKRSAELLYLFSRPEFLALLKANERQAERLGAMRSLLNTGALPEPIKPFDRNKPGDGARWLREGSQRCRDFAEDMGYDLPETKPAKPQGKPWQGYLEEFWKEIPDTRLKPLMGCARPSLIWNGYGKRSLWWALSNVTW